MNCPKCGSGTEVIVYANIEVDRCLSCKGIWFDAKEHETLQDIEGSEVIDSGDASIGKTLDQKHDIVCPRCDVFMSTIIDTDRGHLSYEKCPSCQGMFLDAGEFTEYKEDSLMDFITSFKSE